MLEDGVDIVVAEAKVRYLARAALRRGVRGRRRAIAAAWARRRCVTATRLRARRRARRRGRAAPGLRRVDGGEKTPIPERSGRRSSATRRASLAADGHRASTMYSSSISCPWSDGGPLHRDQVVDRATGLDAGDRLAPLLARSSSYDLPRRRPRARRSRRTGRNVKLAPFSRSGVELNGDSRTRAIERTRLGDAANGDRFARSRAYATSTVVARVGRAVRRARHAARRHQVDAMRGSGPESAASVAVDRAARRSRGVRDRLGCWRSPDPRTPCRTRLRCDGASISRRRSASRSIPVSPAPARCGSGPRPTSETAWQVRPRRTRPRSDSETAD